MLYLGDNVVINQARRAIKIVRRPVVVGVVRQVRVDQVVDELAKGRLDSRGSWDSRSTDHLVAARRCSALVYNNLICIYFIFPTF